MQGVESAERNGRSLRVASAQHLTVFPFHIRSQFHQPQLAGGDILQELSVKLLRIAGLQDAFRLLPLEGGTGFLECDSGGDGLGWRPQSVVLKRSRVWLLRVKLHQSGRVPVTHLAALGAEVVQNLFRRRRGFAGGAALAQLPQPCQPSPPAE